MYSEPTINFDTQRAPFKRVLRMYVKQGDVDTTTAMQDTVAAAAGANLATGSICYLAANKQATPFDITDGGASAGTGAICPIPYIVKIGTDKLEVQGEQLSAAAGRLTVLPLVGNYRIATSVYDRTHAKADYAVNTLLTATVQPAASDATYPQTVGAGLLTVATGPYVVGEPVVAIVAPETVTSARDQEDTLSFFAFFLPAAREVALV